MKNNTQKQDVEAGLNINWFPGHMKKATDEIKSLLKNVDLIIEVVDARAINSSSNPELLNLVSTKPIIKLALKSDLASVNENNDVLITTINNKNLRKIVINKIHEKLINKINFFIKKGLVNPKFLVLVVGLPNVGKSTLINILKNKKTLKTENFPGVTKKQTIVQIDKNIAIVDTPGILLKKINNINTAYKLVLINSIKKEVLSIDPILEYGFNHYYKYHKKELLNYYLLEDVKDYWDFINKICISKKWLTKNNEIDINRFHTNIFNDFSLAKICKTNFDK